MRLYTFRGVGVREEERAIGKIRRDKRIEKDRG